MTTNENAIATTVWIVGQCLEPAPSGRSAVWEFQGVFLTESEAVRACCNDRCFVGPAILGQSLPEESTGDWPGAYYPLREAKP